MGSALFVASLMQTFLQAPRVEIANFFKFIDIAFQGSISSAGEPKPSYYALKMYSRHFGDVLVPAAVESPGFDNKAIGLSEARHNVPYLIATASLSEDKSRLFILAVNRSFTAPIHAKVRIAGFRPADAAKLWLLSAPSLDANNGPDLPDVPGLKWPAPAHAPRNSMFSQGKPATVTIQEAAFRGAAGEFDLEIPPIAVVSLEMTARRPASKP
jgi:alpha-L-arabinofuranosidase